MGLVLINPIVLLPVLFLSLPFYFISKYIERKIQPRKSGRQLVLWFVMVILSAGLYFFALLLLFSWAVNLKIFNL